MLTLGLVEREAAALPVRERQALLRIFQALLQDRPTSRTVLVTTPPTAGTVFTVEHGLPFPPTVLRTGIVASQVGATAAPLTIARPPDSRRLYLTSTVANATVWLTIEA